MSTRQLGSAVAAGTGDAELLRMVGAIAWAAQDAPDRTAQAGRLLTLLMNGVRSR